MLTQASPVAVEIGIANKNRADALPRRPRRSASPVRTANEAEMSFQDDDASDLGSEVSGDGSLSSCTMSTQGSVSISSRSGRNQGTENSNGLPQNHFVVLERHSRKPRRATESHATLPTSVTFPRSDSSPDRWSSDTGYNCEPPSVNPHQHNRRGSLPNMSSEGGSADDFGYNQFTSPTPQSPCGVASIYKREEHVTHYSTPESDALSFAKKMMKETSRADIGASRWTSSNKVNNDETSAQEPSASSDESPSYKDYYGYEDAGEDNHSPRNNKSSRKSGNSGSRQGNSRGSNGSRGFSGSPARSSGRHMGRRGSAYGRLEGVPPAPVLNSIPEDKQVDDDCSEAGRSTGSLVVRSVRRSLSSRNKRSRVRNARGMRMNRRGSM